MKKITTCFLCMSLVSAIMGSYLCVDAKSLPKDKKKYSPEKLIELTADENTYDRFILDNTDIHSGEKIVLKADAAKVTEEGYSWNFEAIEGRYYLKAEYIVKNKTLSDIEAAIKVNGATQYSELNGFVFPKEYKDAKKAETDIYGNHITPEQILSEKMVSTYIFDYAGVYADPLSVALSNGNNSLDLTVSTNEIELKNLFLIPATEKLSYKQYLKENRNHTFYDGENILVEGENASLKSDSVLASISDRSSPLVSPVKTGIIVLNTIGGYSWKSAGQYIKWEVEVPEDGMYSLSFKVRQNRNVGQKVYRSVYINGEIPFKEAASIPVEYSSEWKMITLGGNNPQFVYLNKGKNEITLAATLGESDTIIRAVDNMVDDLNKVYADCFAIVFGE